jgi:hypothetical protein
MDHGSVVVVGAHFAVVVAVRDEVVIVSHVHQGCQMAYFQNKNPNLGEFWRVLQWNKNMATLTYTRIVCVAKIIVSFWFD